MIKEFRDFLLRGNIIELAVAFVIGAAFALVVKSFNDNIITPIIAMLGGKPDFSGLYFTINGAQFRWGAFLTDLLWTNDCEADENGRHLIQLDPYAYRWFRGRGLDRNVPRQ